MVAVDGRRTSLAEEGRKEEKQTSLAGGGGGEKEDKCHCRRRGCTYTVRGI